MHTLGYRFRPWTQAAAIADGPSILHYVRDTAADAGIGQHIRFGHRVVRASWSSAAARWTVQAVHGAETVTMTCGFLLMCSGYYSYDKGYLPSFAGIGDFRGQVVHPQQWPVDLDYAGQRIVVIGSGATAVTLVPAMAETAGHVTMLQRSPTYILPMPTEDAIAVRLRALLGTRRGYAVTRWKNVLLMTAFYKLSRRRPAMIRDWIRKLTIKQLPAGYDVGTHFNPAYNPWDQRLCLVPDGDLFKAISDGRASVVTDRIVRFTERGLLLESGTELEADIVVTATGLQLLPLGGIELTVDDRPVSLPETMAYKGMMLSGVPNFAFTIGYTNASWTLEGGSGERVHLPAAGVHGLPRLRHLRPGQRRPGRHRAAPDGLLGRLCAPFHRSVPAGWLPGSVAARHELRPRRGHPPVRQDQRWRDALLTSAPDASTARGGRGYHRPFCLKELPQLDALRRGTGSAP